MQYVMLHDPGQTPRSHRRRFFAALAHGVKWIHLYHFQPASTGGGDPVFGRPTQGLGPPTTGTVPTPARGAEWCAICLAQLQKGERYSALPCAHSYHEECLSTWLQRQASCPSCRAPVDIDICAAAKQLCDTVAVCRPSPRAVEGVLRLADRLTGSMVQRMRSAAAQHNDSRDCQLVFLLEVDVIRNQVLGTLAPHELWHLRTVSKAFGGFCQETLADLPQVLLAGGIGGVSGSVVTRSAELFDFGSMSWLAAAPMHCARFDPASCELPCAEDEREGSSSAGTAGRRKRSHDMFVAGGASAFESIGMMIHRPDPRVSPFCLCGSAISSAEMYCSARNAWSLVKPMPQGRLGARAVGIEEAATGRSQVLVMGGVGRGSAADPPPAFLSSVIAYDVASNTWDCSRSPMLNRRADFGVSVLPNGRILVAGGSGFSGSESADDDEGENPWSCLPIATVEVYDVALDLWAAIEGPSIARDGCLLSSVGTSDGCVGVWGGVGASPTRTQMEPEVPVLWSSAAGAAGATAISDTAPPAEVHVVLLGAGQGRWAGPRHVPRGCVGHAVCTIERGCTYDDSESGIVWLCGGIAEPDQELKEGRAEQSVSCFVWCDDDRPGSGDSGSSERGRWLRLPNMRSERAAFACSALPRAAASAARPVAVYYVAADASATAAGAH